MPSTIEIAVDPAPPSSTTTISERLYSTAIDLDMLGVERRAIDRRELVPHLQEVSEGRSINVPAQIELNLEKEEASLVWLASSTGDRPHRFILTMRERSSATLPFPAVQVKPDLNDQVWITYDNRQLLGYTYSSDYPKPFFYPVNGPSGRSLTRLGHPRDFSGGHDHHRSLWIEHMDVNGVSFETEHLHLLESEPSIVGVGQQVHRGFLRQEDGPLFASLAMKVDWISHTGETLLREVRCVRVYPLAGGEQLIDFVLTFHPQVEEVTFGKTSFGILAVRFATPLEVTRGGGCIRNSRGQINEAELHLQPAEWCDYSGPIVPEAVNGLAIFDHPDNVHFPSPWHVRDDGWLCVAPFYRDAVTYGRGRTLACRYRIFVHEGNDPARIAARYAEYANPPRVTLTKGSENEL